MCMTWAGRCGMRSRVQTESRVYHLSLSGQVFDSVVEDEEDLSDAEELRNIIKKLKGQREEDGGAAKTVGDVLHL